jgi:peptidoglycan/xylan/chitin deacetylase (PgdA/CDA1 family)
MLSAALTCLAAAPTLAAGFYGGPMLVRRREEHRLRACCRRSRTVVLTYDDGPGPASTPPLLELLARYGVRATFFITGFRAAEHPALVDRIARESHEIGCHSHAHLHAWRSAPWRAAADVEHGYRSLRRWVGRDALYRPPYGKCDAWTWRHVKRGGASMGWWTIDSGDAADDLPHSSPALERVRRDGGGIVLMHDFDRETRRIEFMLETTEHLLTLARMENWNVRTYGSLLDMSRPEESDLLECPAST